MAHDLVAVGVSRAGHGFRFARRHASIGVVMACLGGRGWAGFDGRAHRFAEGDVFRMPAGAWCSYWSERAPWTLAWVCFLEVPPRPTAVPGPPALARGDGGTLLALIEALQVETAREPNESAVAHLCALIDLGARRLAGAGATRDELAALWRAVDADLARPWRLSDLARIAGMGAESLRLACARSTGRSPMAQVSWLRMRRAAILLADRESKVAEVARIVGYGNPFAFSTAFKRWMSMAPATYQGTREDPMAIRV